LKDVIFLNSVNRGVVSVSKFKQDKNFEIFNYFKTLYFHISCCKVILQLTSRALSFTEDDMIFEGHLFAEAYC